MNRKLNILRCGDQRWWIYARIAKDHAKYSRHNVTYAKWDEVNLNGIDVIYINSPDISNWHADTLPLIAKSKGIKVIGGYAGNPKHWSNDTHNIYKYADLIVGISPETYAFAKAQYKDVPVIFLPESVDTTYFTPKVFNPTSFKVGWAGAKHKKIKRFDIARSLSFPIEVQDNWKELHRTNSGIDIEAMKNFYHSIDCLIVTSESECAPAVIMEAMACALPVISTRVGTAPYLLNEEWIVPVNPIKDTIEQMDKQLKLLQSNIELRKSVGESNRKWISQWFACDQTTEIWDSVIEKVYNNDL